jgi:hypothetical protein
MRRENHVPHPEPGSGPIQRNFYVPRALAEIYTSPREAFKLRNAHVQFNQHPDSDDVCSWAEFQQVGGDSCPTAPAIRALRALLEDQDPDLCQYEHPGLPPLQTQPREPFSVEPEDTQLAGGEGPAAQIDGIHGTISAHTEDLGHALGAEHSPAAAPSTEVPEDEPEDWHDEDIDDAGEANAPTPEDSD